MKKILFIFIAITLSTIFFAKYASAVTIEITALVPGCGDGLIGVGEECDGSNLGGASCVSRGFSSGSLSCSSACLYDTSSCVVFSGGGGGGGGGGRPSSVVDIPLTNVVFTGRAYPKSTVTLMKDAMVVATTIAGNDSLFQMTISGVASGNYIFSVYSEDDFGVRSSLLTFPVGVTSGVTTKVSGIFVAPSIAVDKKEVKRGDIISIFGKSSPDSNITISVHSEEEFFIQQKADNNGAYLLNFDSSVLSMGQHQTKSRSSVSNEISSFSSVLGFIVGDKNVLAAPLRAQTKKADINNDNKVNLFDFSIVAFWYKRPLSDDFKKIEIEKFNGDGKVDLLDLSMVAFNWTG